MHLAHLSVCLYVCHVQARNFKNKKRSKIKIGVHVSQGTSKWCSSFQLKSSKVKVTGCQKPQKNCRRSVVHVYSTYRWQIKRRQLWWRGQTRPKLLLATYHVGTRHRHILLSVNMLLSIYKRTAAAVDCAV